MFLTMGDVVREQGTQALGTVSGVTEHANGDLVALRLSGGGTHHADPHNLTLVARSALPSTGGRQLFSLLLLVVGFLAAYFGASAAQELGGDWLVIFLSGSGGCTTVLAVGQFLLRLTGPRRFRV